MPSVWMETGPLAALAMGIVWILGWVDSGYVIFDRKLCSFLNGAAAFLASVGVTPSHSAFSMHALVVDHYIEGGFYPRGGTSEIAFHTIPVIQRAGGAVLTHATVQSVLLDSAGKACGESPASCFLVPGLGWDRTGVLRESKLWSQGGEELITQGVQG